MFASHDASTSSVPSSETIEGTARISERDPGLGRWATRIAGRYMGEGLAEDYGERNSVEGELLLRVMPDKIVARKNVSD